LLVASKEVLRIAKGKEVRVEIRLGLLVLSVLDFKQQASPGVSVAQFPIAGLYTPAIGVESVVGAQRGAVGQIIHGAKTGGIGIAGFGVDFTLVAVAARGIGIQVAHLAIGIVEKTFIGGRLHPHIHNQR